MNYINFDVLLTKQAELRAAFNCKKPFRYLVVEDFFKPDAANKILSCFPEIDSRSWDGTTYIDQKNKFQKSRFETGSLFNKLFAELNSQQFLEWLETLSGIKELKSDEDLFGGGLHQSISGAFLNVHIDYNIHPVTKFHRRLNVLIYMNKNWQDVFGGQLELWDMEHKQLLESISPTFNKCIIFETNEVSYHGHPKPLNTPSGLTRKSIATYYYTATHPAEETILEHNTKFVNTEGLIGQFKRFKAGLKAFVERNL